MKKRPCGFCGGLIEGQAYEKPEWNLYFHPACFHDMPAFVLNNIAALGFKLT